MKALRAQLNGPKISLLRLSRTDDLSDVARSNVISVIWRCLDVGTHLTRSIDWCIVKPWRIEYD
jgi:hypothetical protein